MDELPAPPRPGRESSRPRRAPRRTLTREAIVDAALRVLDADGLDAVTMRRVAQELGTGGASLYAHVDSKEDLIDLVRDRVIGEARVPRPDPDNWREQVKQVLREFHRVQVAHRDIARASLANIPLTPNALEKMDALLAILRTSGLPDQVIAFAAALLGLYVTAVAAEDSIYDAKLTPEEQQRYFDELGSYIHSLPASRFPNMAALATEMTTGDSAERFEFGLEVLLRGLETYAS